MQIFNCFFCILINEKLKVNCVLSWVSTPLHGYRDLSGHVAALLVGQAPLNLKIVSRSTRWKDHPRRGRLTLGSSAQGWWKWIGRLPTMNNQPVSLPKVMSKWRSATLHRWELEWHAQPISDCKRPPTREASHADLLTQPGTQRTRRFPRKRCNSKHCPCGFGPETAEHVLWEYLRFTDGRPPDGTSISEARVLYMESTIRKLWKYENPNFNGDPE